jgi:hypothetical protein
MAQYPPPLLRPRINVESRAQWLWHLSWAGLLVGSRAGPDPDSWALDDSNFRYRADELGYPVETADDKAAGRSVSRSDRPDGEALWELFVEAATDAPGGVRHALGRGMRRDELEVWWAAHAAAPLLPGATSVKQAPGYESRANTCPRSTGTRQATVHWPVRGALQARQKTSSLPTLKPFIATAARLVRGPRTRPPGGLRSRAHSQPARRSASAALPSRSGHHRAGATTNRYVTFPHDQS